VSKVLDFSLDASRDEHINDDYLYRDSHRKADEYSSKYVARRKEEESTTFIENMMVFESNDIHFMGGSNLQQSENTEDLYDKRCPSEPSSKRW
jgi:hypothetical protein